MGPVTREPGVARLAARVALSIGRERLGPTVRCTQAHQVPPSVEAITPEWLTAVLGRGVPGAQVVAVDVHPSTAGTSVRQAMTVTWNDAGRGADLPRHLFTKATSSMFSRLLLGVTSIAEGEALFFDRMRPELDLRSPRGHYAGFDPRTFRSMAVLEDLAVQGWRFPNPMRNPVSRADAEDMVDQMARYHAAFWDSPRFAHDLDRLQGAHTWQQKLNRKVGFRKRTLTGLDRAADVVPPELLRRRDELYPAFMRSLERHGDGPQTLLHQDVHLGNWLRDPDGRMGLYDWQCVARGNWAMDVSYAMACALATEDRGAWERELVEQYVERLGHHGVVAPPGREEAWTTYRQQPMHGLVFGLFTLGGSRLTPELQPPDYTRFAIRRLARAVVELDTLDAVA